MTTDLPPAIIFDMDDTILSDDKAAEKCWRQVCNDMWHRIQSGTPEEFLDDITAIRRWYWADPERIRRSSLNLALARRELLSMAFEKHGIDDDNLLEEMSAVYQKLKAATIEVIPGALDTLRSLGNGGIRLGLITNGDAEAQRDKVRKAGLEPLFDSTLVAGEFGVAKPDPQIFLHTLERLQVEPHEAWMVGDNLYADIGGAQAVGIRGVWVDWRGNGLPDNTPAIPYRTIQSIVELNPANTE